MSLDTTQIGTYVDRNVDEILKSVLFGFDSQELVTFRPGIKHKESIGKMASDALWQAGACGFTSKGMTNLNEVEIEVTPLKINETICQQDLDNTYYNLLGKAGAIAGDADFVLEEMYVEEKIAQAQKSLEKHIWLGDTASSDTSINQIDGLVKDILANIPDARTGSLTAMADNSDHTGVYTTFTTSAAHGLEEGQRVTISSTTNYDGTYTARVNSSTSFDLEVAFVADDATGTWTEVQDQKLSRSASVYDDAKALINTMPADFFDLEGQQLVMSRANYRSLINELVDLGGSGNFHFGSELLSFPRSFMLPGEEVKITYAKGLTGDNGLYLSFKENFWVGTDLVNDFETARFWYDDSEDEHRFMLKVKVGTKVAYSQWVAASV